MTGAATLLGAEGHGDTVVEPWWSLTKSVIAAALMRLAEDGALDLDAPQHGQPFTTRQLMGHTAGVKTYGGPVYQAAVARGDAPWSVTELLARRRVDDLLFTPGEGWAYSNIGYLYLRQVIERLTGQPLDPALRDLVLAPMGLTATRLAETPEDLTGTLWGNPDGYHPGWVYHGLLIGPPTEAVSFLSRLLSPDFLRTESRTEMTEPRPLGGPIEGRPWTRAGYGLGLMIGEMTDAGRAIGHSGVGPGSVSACYLFADLPGQPVAASFAQGPGEGVTEWDALARARALSVDSGAPER